MAKHRVLVIGVGSIGERHLRCFQQTGRAEVGLCELNPTLRQTIAERYKIDRVFDNLDAAIASGFDIAVVCTPAQFHIPQATQLVNAGLAVLIEKPLSISFDGIDALQKLITAKKATVGVGYTWRSIDTLRWAHEQIHSGKFGKPQLATVVTGQHFPTFRPAYREIYYKDHKSGGGAIQDALTHMLNAVEWLVGPITRLCVDAEHMSLEGVTVEDTANVLARHGNVLANYTLCQFQYPNETTITVHCEKGCVKIEAHNNRVLVMTERASATNPNQWVEQKFETAERDTWFIKQAAAFLDAVEGKVPVRCTLEDGLQTLKVNLAALDSWRSGAWRDVK